MRAKVKADNEHEAKESSPAGSRSPAYPAYDLREAVGKLGMFFAKCRRHPASLDAAYAALGYSSANGAAKRSLAALRAYGLVEAVPGKDSEVRLSQLGFVVENHRENDPERQEALRTAAQRPKIYRELHQAYGDDLPGDNLLYDFLIKRGFSRDAIPGVIGPFRSTFEFADLANAGKVVEEEQDEDDLDEQERAREREAEAERKRKESERKGVGMTSTVDPSEGMAEMPVPLGIGRKMVLYFPEDVSDDDLDFFNMFWDGYQKRLKAQRAKAAHNPELND